MLLMVAIENSVEYEQNWLSDVYQHSRDTSMDNGTAMACRGPREYQSITEAGLEVVNTNRPSTGANSTPSEGTAFWQYCACHLHVHAF